MAHVDRAASAAIVRSCTASGTSTADAVLDLAAREHVTTIGIIGDAMARPLAEAVLARARPLGLLVDHRPRERRRDAERGREVATRPAFPSAIVNDSYGVSETGAAGSEVGASTERDRPGVHDRRPHVGARSRHARTVGSGSGVRGSVRAPRATSRIGYWNDPEKTAATFRTDRNGVRWVVPGDWATIDADGHIVLFGRGSGCINYGRREGVPRRGRGRDPRPPRRVRRGRRRCSRRAFRAAGRRAREVARRCAGARRSTRCRSTAARRSRATRFPACSSSARRPAPTRTSPTTRPPQNRARPAGVTPTWSHVVGGSC